MTSPASKTFLSKRTIFDEMLCETGDVYTLSVPGEHTALPPHLIDKPVTLRWNSVGANPIKGLQTDDQGIYASLSFGGVPEAVFIDWEDVRAVWCDLCGMQYPVPTVKAEPAPTPKTTKGAHLRLVK